MLKDSEKMKYVADAGSTLEEAWTKIELNRHRSVIVVDQGRVVGTLSDGDIRKAMLAHRLLSISVKDVMNKNFTFLTKDNISEAEDIFQKGIIFIIPVVNKKMQLLDLFIAPIKP